MAQAEVAAALGEAGNYSLARELARRGQAFGTRSVRRQPLPGPTSAAGLLIPVPAGPTTALCAVFVVPDGLRPRRFHPATR